MTINSLSFQGKLAIVTGARRGIGRAIALALAEAGADIAICDRVIEDGGLASLTQEVQGMGRRCLSMQTDIGNKNDVDEMVRRVAGEFGHIDVLINNAARNIGVPLLELREHGWDEIIRTNLKGCFLCCQSVASVMVPQRRGTIVNMASVWGLRAAERQGAYCVAKAGIVMLTKVLALELAKYNIRVNAIAPGVVKTELSRAFWEDPKALKTLEEDIPLGRLGSPQDIVGCALFLASSASNYVTGHTLVADGGWLSL